MMKNNENFIGRKDKIEEIFTHLSNGESISVIGKKGIGKSSLLNHIYLLCKEKGNYMPARVDVREIIDIYDFVSDVLTELNIDTTQIEEENHKKNLRVFKNEMKKMKDKTDKTIVILVDHFESFFREGKERKFYKIFFDLIFTLGQGYIAFVATSRKPLDEVCKGVDLRDTSPAWTIFSNSILIDKFTEEEVDEFITAKRNEFKFNDEEIELIYELGNHHPFDLKLVCKLVLEAKMNGKVDKNRITKDFKEEIEYFKPVRINKDIFKGLAERERKFIEVLYKDSGGAWKRTQRYIAKTTGMSNSTVSRAAKSLGKKDLIERISEGNTKWAKLNDCWFK